MQPVTIARRANARVAHPAVASSPLMSAVERGALMDDLDEIEALVIAALRALDERPALRLVGGS